MNTKSRGWLIAGGILSIIVGLLALSSPILFSFRASLPGLIQLFLYLTVESKDRRQGLHNHRAMVMLDHFCLRSFFATESAFLAVVFSFNLLSEFQRAIDPAHLRESDLVQYRQEWGDSARRRENSSHTAALER
jgi:hypothetical protein